MYLHPLAKGKNAICNSNWRLIYSIKPFFLVGPRDNTSLPENAISSCWDSSWLKGWCKQHWKAGQSTAKAYCIGEWRKVGTWIKSSEICRVFRFNTKRLKKCIWWSDLSSTGAAGGTKEEEVLYFVKKQIHKLIYMKNMRNCDGIVFSKALL